MSTSNSVFTALRHPLASALLMGLVAGGAAYGAFGERMNTVERDVSRNRAEIKELTSAINENTKTTIKLIERMDRRWAARGQREW